MRLLVGLLKNGNVLICLVIGLFACDSQRGKPIEKTATQRQIDPQISCPSCKNGKPSGFVLWLSQDANYVALVIFNKDTNGDGEVEAKIGEHGELLADRGSIAWVNTLTQKTTFYDSFLGSDKAMRMAVLKKDNEIFVVNTASGTPLRLEGAQASGDSANPCLPSREAVLSVDGDRVVFPLGPKSYRSLNLESKDAYDVNTEFLLWRARPSGNGEEVFEIVKDRNGDGLVFPKSQSTCACDWCPRFARSVGSYGSVGDQIRKSVYQNGKRQTRQKTFAGCRSVGKNEGSHSFLECGHSFYRGNKKSGVKTPISHKIKIASYENPILDGWFPLLVLGEEGLRMGRYNVDRNVLERGPHVSRYAKKAHVTGFWLGRSKEKNIVWSLRSNQFRVIKRDLLPTTFDGLTLNTKQGRYIVDGFTGATKKIEKTPTLSSANGCVLFRTQTHRITTGPWEISCP